MNISQLEKKASISPDAFQFFCNFARSSTGIILGEDKHYFLADRLGPLAISMGYSSINELYLAVRNSIKEELKRKIVGALTTNETLFFRDSAPFEFFANTLLPRLRESRKSTRILRIWSAACSSGQEISSFMITLAEHAPDLLNWNIHILATDISEEILDRARQGLYSHIEVQRGMPMNLLARYFKKEGQGWRFDENLRRRVVFRQMNLNDSFAGMGQFDIILCRYVLIYFDVEAKREIFRKFRDALPSDGYLFLGASEGIFGLTSLFTRETDGKCVYYKPA